MLVDRFCGKILAAPEVSAELTAGAAADTPPPVDTEAVGRVAEADVSVA